jgi:hypothetical protein
MSVILSLRRVAGVASLPELLELYSQMFCFEFGEEREWVEKRVFSVAAPKCALLRFEMMLSGWFQ